MEIIFSQILAHADSWWTGAIIFLSICYYIRKRRLRPKFIAETAVIKCICKDIMNGYYNNMGEKIDQYIKIFAYEYQVQVNEINFRPSEQLLKLAIAQCMKKASAEQQRSIIEYAETKDWIMINNGREKKDFIKYLLFNMIICLFTIVVSCLIDVGVNPLEELNGGVEILIFFILCFITLVIISFFGVLIYYLIDFHEKHEYDRYLDDF